MTNSDVVQGWMPKERVRRAFMVGERIRLEPLDPDRHGPPMFEAHSTLDPEGQIWSYLPYGPFEDWEPYRAHLQIQANSADPLFFAIIDSSSDEAVGVASYLRNDPENGVVEVGHICMTPRLQQTPMATEAMYLMMKHAFEDLGYRRYEWKCNAANEASKRAAIRLGMTKEGVFRQHMVVKGHNRDTAWFSILDHEWPEQKLRFDKWLSPDNFDAKGRQKVRLEEV